MTWFLRKQSSNNKKTACSPSRANRIRTKTLHFQQRFIARRERAARTLECRKNAFKHAGIAFRLWWLSLLGVVSKWLEPIRGQANLRRRSGGKPSFSHNMRGSAAYLNVTGGTESLEDRVLLAANLTYPDSSLNEELTLSFDAGQYRLLNSVGAVVSSAAASGASSGGIVIQGTTTADALRLDVASLSSAGSTATITFVGDGDDTVAVLLTPTSA